MKDENTKVKITVPISVDRPNRNGTVFTREAVENAVSNLHKHIPIIYRDDRNRETVIGTTVGDSHIVTWDSENQVCKMTVDGVVFYSGAELNINEIKDGKITSFSITGVRLMGGESDE